MQGLTVTTSGEDAPVEAPSPTRPGRARSRPGGVALVVLLGAIVAVSIGVALRFVTVSELWLDEALSVNIAKLPLSELPEALRHDGSPPLYYLLLHGWIALVGDGNLAVRSLGALFSVASLPLVWLAARRLGGSRTAWAALILLATSPFAIRFASQARMYSLVVLLSLAGFLALSHLLEKPRPLNVVGVGVVSGLLALTHYWTFYLLAAVLAVLAVRAITRAGVARRHSVVAGAAICSGALLFLPWLRSFLYQLRYTGTPWAASARFRDVFDTIGEFAGGYNEAGRGLLLVVLALAALGLFGRATDGHQVELDLRTQPAGRGVAAVSILALVLGIGSGVVLGGGFAYRYTSVALVPFLLLVALGARCLADARVRHGVLAIAAVLGLAGGWYSTQEQRTQAGVVAQAIESRASDGDVVAYCPDQLGPAVSRLLPDRFRQLTFPRETPPQRVDWAQYAEHQAAANPTAFAQKLDRMAGDGKSVWVVWAPRYRTFKNFCEIIDKDLGDMRPSAKIVVPLRPGRYGEPSYLVQYGPACRRPLAERYLSPRPGCPVRTARP